MGIAATVAQATLRIDWQFKCSLTRTIPECKDVESEEAQEHTNSSSLALYEKAGYLRKASRDATAVTIQHDEFATVFKDVFPRGLKLVIALGTEPAVTGGLNPAFVGQSPPIWHAIFSLTEFLNLDKTGY
jgi:hypothetical protein